MIILALIPMPPVMALIAAVGIVYDTTRILKKTGAGKLVLDRLVGTPEKTTAFSFIVMICVGTVLLMLPRSVAGNGSIGFVDALFTATSAHCVTGLTVINTAMDGWARADLPALSTFGQTVVLLLIQIGGLGIMTLSSASIALFSGKLRFDTRNFVSRSVARFPARHPFHDSTRQAGSDNDPYPAGRRGCSTVHFRLQRGPAGVHPFRTTVGQHVPVSYGAYGRL